MVGTEFHATAIPRLALRDRVQDYAAKDEGLYFLHTLVELLALPVRDLTLRLYLANGFLGFVRHCLLDEGPDLVERLLGKISEY